MIDLKVARELRAAGLAWNPLPGDRFVVPDRGMDEEVFVVSNMVVEIHDLPGGGQLIGPDSVGTRTAGGVRADVRSTVIGTGLKPLTIR